VCGAIGHCSSLEQKNRCVSDTGNTHSYIHTHTHPHTYSHAHAHTHTYTYTPVIGIGRTSTWSLGGLDTKSTIALYFEVTNQVFACVCVMCVRCACMCAYVVLVHMFLINCVSFLLCCLFFSARSHSRTNTHAHTHTPPTHTYTHTHLQDNATKLNPGYLQILTRYRLSTGETRLRVTTVAHMYVCMCVFVCVLWCVCLCVISCVCGRERVSRECDR